MFSHRCQANVLYVGRVHNGKRNVTVWRPGWYLTGEWGTCPGHWTLGSPSLELIKTSLGGTHLIPLTRIGCGMQGWISFHSNHSLTFYTLFCSFYFTQQKTCHRRPSSCLQCYLAGLLYLQVGRKTTKIVSIPPWPIANPPLKLHEIPFRIIE